MRAGIHQPTIFLACGMIASVRNRTLKQHTPSPPSSTRQIPIISRGSMSTRESRDNQRGTAPVSPLSFHQPNMSKHCRRSSSRLQPIAPGLLPEAIFEEGVKAGSSIDMETSVNVGAASKTALKPSAKRQAVTSVACGHCQKQKSKVSVL